MCHYNAFVVKDKIGLWVFSFREAFVDFHQDHCFISAWNPHWYASFSNTERLITRNGQAFSGGNGFPLRDKYVIWFFPSKCWFCYPFSFLKLLLMGKIYISFSLFFLIEMDFHCRLKASEMDKWIFSRYLTHFQPPTIFLSSFLLLML